jgi:ankyrin repeat protein
MRLLLENNGLAVDRLRLALEHSLEPHQRSGEPFYDIAECILQHGFDINESRAGPGRSLLHGAANRGTIKATKWLLDKGAVPNKLDADGRTPLHVSAQRNTSTAVIKLLLDAGSDPNAADVSGKTALDYARDNKRVKVVKYLESIGRQRYGPKNS